MTLAMSPTVLLIPLMPPGPPPCSCFYRHMYPDGRLESRTPDLRFAKSAEGDSKVLGTVRLSDFLEIRTTGRSRGLGRRR
jgi:hypothetical protein